MKRHSPGAGFLFAVLLACFISQASAAIIEVDFTGLAFGIRPTISETNVYNSNQFSQKPFTVEFVFDTDLGILGDHRLDGGLVDAFINLEGFPTWRGAYWQYGGSFLTWNDALTDIVANAGSSYQHLFIHYSISGDFPYGTFQFGLCPTTQGGPCGYMTSIQSMTITGLPIAHTPGPIAGAGIPGLLLTIGGLLVYHRRNRHQS